MVASLERLNFILSLVDQVSRPLRAVQSRLSALNAQVERSTRHVTTGFLAGSGAVLGLVGALKPAIDHAQALREVASLGVEPAALAQLSRAGMDYAARFGESATAFVRSAYDIQSAIAGLNGADLARFTTAANITAKATKASAAEVTSFFGTMFGIFQKQADAPGRGRWVEVLAGQTARAVQIFKTTGPELSRAFTQLGADATAMGLSMAEQFAVLGRLQATMGGAEAATRFRAFLRGVGQAQGALGLRFTDTAGQMLALPEILERIRGKFGQIDTVAKSDLLKKAFGSDEAVSLVKLLVADTNGLRRNITAIGQGGSLQAAAKMAQAMVDPFQRLQRVVENVVITWGSFLLPLITPYIERLTEAGAAVRAWAERYPYLARLTGVATLAVLGFTLAIAALKIAVGLLGFALLPFRAGLMLLRAAVPVGVWLVSAGAMVLWRGALLTLQGVLLLARGAMLLFNAALWANPITWVVALVVGLIAAVALAILYWDDLKTAAGIAAAWIAERWSAALAWIGRGWQSLVAAGQQAWATVTSVVGAAADGITRPWSAALDWLAGRWTDLASVAGEVWGAVQDAGSAAWAAMSAVWNEGLGGLAGHWDAVASSAASAFASVRKAAGTTWGALASVWSTGLDWLHDRWAALAGSAWQATRGSAARAWEGIAGVLRQDVAGLNAAWATLAALWSAGLEALAGRWNALAGAAGSSWQAIQSSAAQTWDSIVGVVQQGLATLNAAWEALGAPARAAFGVLRESVTGFWSWLTDSLEQVAPALGDFLERLPARLITGLSAALEQAAEALGDFFASLPARLAAGVSGALEGLLAQIQGVVGPDSLLGKALGAFGISLPSIQPAAGDTAVLAQAPRAEVIGGEVRQAIRNVASSTDNSRRLTIGTVNVTSSRRLDAHELIRHLQLAADG